MKKYLFVLMAIFVSINSGCAIEKDGQSKSIQKQNKKTEAPKEKIITWCDNHTMNEAHEKFHQGGLWISSEYSNGMVHSPTIQHFCREDKELFSLEIQWSKGAFNYKGNLISKKSGILFPVTSTNQDPEMQLIEERNKNQTNQAWFTIDGKTFMYDENMDKFIKNPKL